MPFPILKADPKSDIFPRKLGVPADKIARVLTIDPKTLRKHYRDELDTGHIKANSKVAENLYRKALGEGPQSVTAAIFWLKTRAQWKETTVSEVTHDSTGTLTGLMERIAEQGRHLTDPPPASQTNSGSWPGPSPTLRLLQASRLGQISTRLPSPEPLEANASAGGSIVPLIEQRKVA